MVTKQEMTVEKALAKPVLSVRKADREWVAELTQPDGRMAYKNFGAISPTVAALLYFSKTVGVSDVEWRICNECK